MRNISPDCRVHCLFNMSAPTLSKVITLRFWDTIGLERIGGNNRRSLSESTIYTTFINKTRPGNRFRKTHVARTLNSPTSKGRRKTPVFTHWHGKSVVAFTPEIVGFLLFPGKTEQAPVIVTVTPIAVTRDLVGPPDNRQQYTDRDTPQSHIPGPHLIFVFQRLQLSNGQTNAPKTKIYKFSQSHLTAAALM